jgi:chaperonin GroES|tara:strand:+ start:3456 stop:3752 length:297 start_codon:yes stop_codon:yes gene_type:complete
MKLIPIRDRIVVRLIEAETTTASGLIIPDNAAEKPSQADVIAVGEGKVNDDGTLVPMVIKPGDRVLFSKTSVQEVKVDNEKFHIMRESDVMAILKQGE